MMDTHELRLVVDVVSNYDRRIPTLRRCVDACQHSGAMRRICDAEFLHGTLALNSLLRRVNRRVHVLAGEGSRLFR